jgi:hypothetical protein
MKGDSMSRDDYFAIVYSILKYLYGCLKSGEPVRWDRLDADLYKVPADYWEYVLIHMEKDALIEGISVRRMDDGKKHAKITPRFQITPKGIEYLQDNSLFQRVKDVFLDLSNFIPS